MHKNMVRNVHTWMCNLNIDKYSQDADVTRALVLVFTFVDCSYPSFFPEVAFHRFSTQQALEGSPYSQVQNVALTVTDGE